MRMTGSEQDTTQLIHYPILPGTLKIPVTGDSFWVQCPTFITPLAQQSPEPQDTRESELGFLDTKYVVSLETTSNSPNTHYFYIQIEYRNIEFL